MSLLFTIKSCTGASAEALFLPPVAAVLPVLRCKSTNFSWNDQKNGGFYFPRQDEQVVIR